MEIIPLNIIVLEHNETCHKRKNKDKGNVKAQRPDEDGPVGLYSGGHCRIQAEAFLWASSI